MSLIKPYQYHEFQRGNLLLIFTEERCTSDKFNDFKHKLNLIPNTIFSQTFTISISMLCLLSAYKNEKILISYT